MSKSAEGLNWSSNYTLNLWKQSKTYSLWSVSRFNHRDRMSLKRSKELKLIWKVSKRLMNRKWCRVNSKWRRKNWCGGSYLNSSDWKQRIRSKNIKRGFRGSKNISDLFRLIISHNPLKKLKVQKSNMLKVHKFKNQIWLQTDSNFYHKIKTKNYNNSSSN